MFKRNIFKILAIVFFLLAGASFYNSNKSFGVAQDKSVVKKIISPTPLLPTVVMEQVPTTAPTQVVVLPTNTPVPTSAPLSASPTSVPQQGLRVSLSIGDSSVGSFDIPQGSNQCDILSQALSQGKIQSLNMRYNNDMGTNAVYQINGIGKENAVWWGFKVNAQSPSQGCSYIKVNNGDNVLWEYVGS